MAQVLFQNDSSSELEWDMTWGVGSQSSGDIAVGGPAVAQNLNSGMDQAGFILTNFTGRIVVLINDPAGYTPNIIASNTNNGTAGTLLPAFALQWTNYSASQTVSWVIVTGSTATQAEMAPSSGGTVVSQGLAYGVTAVGFQFSGFSGSFCSVYGSTTLTAELQVQDETEVENLRAIRT